MTDKIKEIEGRITREFHTGLEVDLITLSEDDYEYLKEQAEQVEKMKKKNNKLRIQKQKFMKKATWQRKQKQCYREKLEELEDIGLGVINYGGEIDANDLVDSIRQVEDVDHE